MPKRKLTPKIPLAPPETRPDETLVPSEFRCVAMLVGGARNRDIAAELGVSENCVKTVLKRVAKKTGNENRVTLALWFVKRYPTEEAIRHGYMVAQAHLLGVRKRAPIQSAATRSVTLGLGK
jgi:DNA-binding CsgD family transcriptional regulator